jgi:hypothetical protein
MKETTRAGNALRDAIDRCATELHSLPTSRQVAQQHRAIDPALALASSTEVLARALLSRAVA